LIIKDFKPIAQKVQVHKSRNYTDMLNAIVIKINYLNTIKTILNHIVTPYYSKPNSFIKYLIRSISSGVGSSKCGWAVQELLSRDSTTSPCAILSLAAVKATLIWINSPPSWASIRNSLPLTKAPGKSSVIVL